MRTSSLRLGTALLVPSLALVGTPGCSDDETRPGTGGSGASGSNSGASTGSGAAGAGGPSAGGSSSGGAGTGAGGSATGGGGSGSGGMNTGAYDCSAPSGEIGALKLTEIATGLDGALQVKAAPGDNERLFVVQQNGTIRVVNNGTLVDEPFLEIDVDNSGNEKGLLGLAFHPDYATTGRFLVPYNVANNTHIAEYHATPGGDVADPGEGGTVIDVQQPPPPDFTNHKGGAIEFGKDGMLYIFLGDGGAGGDPMNNAQNLNILLGKVLRLDVASLPGTPPPGNLPGGAPEIWDYGLRNPFRSTFDACTGDLYIGDVGQGAWEEINVEPVGQGNKNYGWRCKEGLVDYDDDGCEGKTFTDPVTVYNHGGGKISVTGGYVYRGSNIPGLRGTYLYGDYGTGQVFTFVWDGSAATQEAELTDDLDSGNIELTSFGQDNTGEVYLVNRNGTVYRIDPE
ncbi:MAG: PQQ-dependent sugar dehydrogenase [Polyangiaceae bacterium]